MLGGEVNLCPVIDKKLNEFVSNVARYVVPRS